MAETIKGINIVIGAETTGLQKSLSDVNKKSRDLQSELRQVEKLLKLDPTNTELLAQKQKLLADAVDNSSDKLTRLKNAQEQVNDQFKKGDISEGQYRAFQREVAKAEQELSKFETQLKETGATAQTTGNDLQATGDKLKGIGGGLSAGVTAPLVAGLALVTEGTREFRMDLSRLDTNAKVAGQSTNILNDAMAKLYAVTGETDSNVEGLSELMATGFRDEQLTELLDSLYGASIKFADTLKFEGISDGLQETLATGAAIGPFGELLERSGIVLNDFNAGLKDAIANGTQEQYVLDVLAKTGLSETYEAYRKNNKEMVESAEAQYRLQKATAELGNTLEPIVTAITKKITELVKWFNELSPTGQKVVLVIAAIVAAIGPLLILVASLTMALPALGAAITFATGPIGLIIAAIAALIAIGILVYKNWDEIKAKASEVWEAVKSAVGNAIAGIKEKISSVVDAGKDIVRGIWDGITSMAGWLYNKVATFVQENIVGTVKNFLGIESPSKVMAEFGRYVAEGLAKGMDEGSEKVSEEAKKMTSAITGAAQAMLGKLNDALTITKAQLDLEATALGNNASEVEKLAIEQKKLNVEKDAAAAKVEILSAAYNTAKKELGETNELTQSYAQSLMSTQIELQKQEILINKNTLAVKNAAAAQVKAFQDIGDEIDAIEKKYQEELIAAAEEYHEKVAELNAQMIEDERQVTEEYENELESRRQALYDFAGLFDQVTTESVSGQQLLENLRGQVDAFDAWQENIAALAARGIDEGLLNELRGMGPEAGAEIAALNTLTKDELEEYVVLWRVKNEEARNEAVNQLQEQKMEMEIKLFEIQAQAAEQLELYKQEWKKKNAEIRKNTEEELNKIADKFNATAEKGTTYGVKLIMNYVAGIESGFEALRAAVEEAQSIAGEIDPTVRHSPSLVDRVQAGTADIFKAYEKLMDNMQGLGIGASLSLQAAAGGSSSTIINNNNINITVQDGEDLLRTLHRLGVAIP